MKLYGHKEVFEYLYNSFKKNKLVNSYIFFGPESIGKSLVAINFSLFSNNIINDLTNIDTNLIEKVKNNNFIDIRYIKGKDSIKIQDIREIIDFSYISNAKLKYKFFIINNAHNLTIQAQQSILKTLEEPPENVIFILITDKLSKLLLTIKSRSQIVIFNAIKEEDRQQIVNNLYNEYKDFSTYTNNNLAILKYLKDIKFLKKDFLLYINILNKLNTISVQDFMYNLYSIVNKYKDNSLIKYLLLIKANYLFYLLKTNKEKIDLKKIINIIKLIDEKLKEMENNTNLILESYITDLFFILKTSKRGSKWIL